MNNKWRLTYPVTLYALLTLVVVALSWIMEVYGVEAVMPSTGGVVKVKSLLSQEGTRWLARNVISNFIGFSPVGQVVMVVLGLGFAFHSGFVEACIRGCFRTAKIEARRPMLTVILLGLLSNVIGDAGYIILLPLAAHIFKVIGMSPMLGLVLAHVSVTCGYSANILVSTLDSSISQLTEEGALGTSVGAYSVGPLSNYYFMALSIPVLACIIYYIARRCLQKQLSDGVGVAATHPFRQLSHKERYALFVSLFVAVVFVISVAIITLSSGGGLRSASGAPQYSPFVMGILSQVSFGFGLTGIVYGIMSGHYRSDTEVTSGAMYMSKLLVDYLLIVFFASQMFAIVDYTNIAKVAVAAGTSMFASLHIGAVSALVCFVIFVSLQNLFVTSATVKWATLAYFALPAFSVIGIAPEYVQCAYRIGDSATNVLTPFMIYVPFMLALMLRYDESSTYITLFRYTWRFSLSVLFCWIIFFVLWFITGLSIGL